MKQVMVSQEVYDQLKSFVVDPFEDTLETVIVRLISIARKAQDRWMALCDEAKSDDNLDTGDILPDIIDDIAEAPAGQSPTAQLPMRDIGEPSTM